MPEIKEETKEAIERRFIMYKESSIKLTAVLSPETMEQRQWDDIFKMLKEKDYKPWILYLAKLYFKNKGELKTFPGGKNHC